MRQAPHVLAAAVALAAVGLARLAPVRAGDPPSEAAPEEPSAAWAVELVEALEVKLYPGLYHCFMPGESKPSDYDRPGHVEAALVDDVARFVAGH